MDPVQNPFAPGAGNPPPELAGRAGILNDADITLQRVRAGRHAKSVLFTGLRGVGKTVLLNRIMQYSSQELKFQTCYIEAHPLTDFTNTLVPALLRLLAAIDEHEAMKEITRRAKSLLRGFASAFKISYSGFDVGIEPASGADSGHLANDLPELLVAVAQAAQAASQPVAIFIDEMQYLKVAELSALIGAMHRIAQLQLPLVLFGAGLPSILGLAGDARSYAERMFDFPQIGALSEDAARMALVAPSRTRNVSFDEDALSEILALTECYPYFLQEWGKACWNLAKTSPITRADVVRASPTAVEALDRDFFSVRYNRLTPRERQYLRAMAELGKGSHKAGGIANLMRTESRNVAPVKNSLIKKGMVYSPAHGDTAYTVPMFGDFMEREMPGSFVIDAEYLDGEES